MFSIQEKLKRLTLFLWILLGITLKMSKGYRCSINGIKYEKQIYEIVKKCRFMKKDGSTSLFNIQTENDLGGCGAEHDMVCEWTGEEEKIPVPIPIEIKKMNTPDWMQCSLHYVDNKWIGSVHNKIPKASKEIFEQLISFDTNTLFNGKIPPFMTRKITHEEWIQIKRETDDFHDVYLDCPEDTIKNLYSYKGCKYIQISEKGLYHLGEDICHFGVPEFLCEQQLRIRMKIHNKKDAKGFCKMSVTVACQPKHIKKLAASNHSLDNVTKLPVHLIYSQ